MTLNIFERLREHIDRSPDAVAFQNISDSERSYYTYRSVWEATNKLGLFLQRSGIGPGRQVGILMESHPCWGIAFLAVQSAGAVAVPLDVMHTPETLARLIEHAECRFLIVSQKLVPAFLEVRRLLPAPLAALVWGDAVEGCAHWDTVLRETSGEATAPLVGRELDDELAIIYTSGTTGTPKGVVLTHRNVYGNVVEILQIIEARSEDHFLSVLPLYHVLSLMTMFIIPLYVGARVTYLQVLDAQRILKTFRDEGISVFVVVPQFFYLVHRRVMQEVERQGALKRFLFRRLLAVSRFSNIRLGWNPGRLFFRKIHEPFGTRLRILGVGGARFDREIAESFRDLGFPLVQAFGMTETAALVTVAPALSEATGSVGKPMPNTQIRIDSPDENGVGVVLARGENVMKGYWKNPDATAEVLKDGWLDTGDLGYIDARGWLHITGRKKDVIVLSSGKNIYPEEVEHFYLSNCPFIKELCVVGIPDAGSGEGEERLHAVIVPDFDYLKSRQVVNAYDQIRWELETLSQRIPAYKRVRSFEVRTDPLPRTTTRKVKRFEVEREVLSGGGAKTAQAAAPETEPESAVEERLFALIRRIKDGEGVGRDMNLELDLGFTSLERVELFSSVQEAFGAGIPEDAASEILTVRDLLRAVEERLTGEGGGTAARVSWSEILKAPLDAEDERRVREILRPRPVVEAVYCGLARIVLLLFRILLRLKLGGRENLPRGYPFLICPSHGSYLDAFLIVAAMPFRVLRRLFVLGDSDYFETPLLAFLGRLAKVIPVNTDRGVRLSLRLAAEGLHRGMVLLVFPEGERSIDGSVKPFRLGPSIVASELGAPVVPAGIAGAWEVWRRGSGKVRLHPVSVSFGEPLTPAAGVESYEAFNRRLREAVVREKERAAGR